MKLAMALCVVSTFCDINVWYTDIIVEFFFSDKRFSGELSSVGELSIKLNRLSL